MQGAQPTLQVIGAGPFAASGDNRLWHLQLTWFWSASSAIRPDASKGEVLETAAFSVASDLGV